MRLPAACIFTRVPGVDALGVHKNRLVNVLAAFSVVDFDFCTVRMMAWWLEWTV